MPLSLIHILAEELSQIDAPEEELGLAHQPGGKDYYLALLQKTTGKMCIRDR